MIHRSLIAAAILFKPGLVCVPHPVAVETDGSSSSGTGSSTTDSSTTDPTVSSSGSTETTSVDPECGNGALESGEECDDGNAIAEDACLPSCKDARCGDGAVWSEMEECDDGDSDDTNACTAACKEARCGDGNVWAGMEECDDGNQIDTDACTSQCKNPVCGDGIKTGGEICDAGEGNVTKEQAAPDQCTTECKIACGDQTKSSLEDCDDGGQISGDGCSPMCAHEYIIFATKEVYAADLGGVAGADEICQMTASASNLMGTYVAWISTDTDGAVTDLPVGNVIFRTDGVTVVNVAEDLVQGPATILLNPIDRDQDGGMVTGYAWTGTVGEGKGVGPTCGGWTTVDGSVTIVGATSGIDRAWTYAGDVKPLSQTTCDALNHLYCFRKAEP